MLLIFGLALLQATVWGGTFDLQLQADLQLRGGYSQTPFITGIDSAPLLNALGNGEGQMQYTTILTPAATLGIKTPRFTLALGYQPRIYVDMSVLSTVPPTVFHQASLQLMWGKTKDWQISAGANISVGGLDFGQAGQLAGEFSGSLRPGASSSAFAYVSTAAFVKAEDWIGNAWHLQTTQAVTRRSTPPVISSNYVLTTEADLLTLQNGAAVPPLQNQAGVDSRYQIGYMVDTKHEIYAALLANITSFQATATYLSYAPSFGWTADIGTLDKLKLELGVMKYWTNPFPGRYLSPVYNVIGEVSWNHKYTDIGAPRLTSIFMIGEAPFYDIIYGQIQPRGTASITFSYQFSRQWQGQAQVRDYTQLYWDGKRVRPLGKGRDRNVLVGNVQVNFALNKYLGFQLGLFGLNRWIVPSGTLPFKTLREYYGAFSVRGSYDVD